jgi:hypothetical protein
MEKLMVSQTGTSSGVLREHSSEIGRDQSLEMLRAEEILKE